MKVEHEKNKKEIDNKDKYIEKIRDENVFLIRHRAELESELRQKADYIYRPKKELETCSKNKIWQT